MGRQFNVNNYLPQLEMLPYLRFILEKRINSVVVDLLDE